MGYKVKVLSIALLAILHGCATIVRSKTARVGVESIPSGAKVWVDGTLRGETPLELTLGRDGRHTVKFAAPGHDDLLVSTDKDLNGWFVLVDAVSGIVWLAVDAATGHWNDVGPGPLRVVLSPTGQDCAQGRCDYLPAEVK